MKNLYESILSGAQLNKSILSKSQLTESIFTTNAQVASGSLIPIKGGNMILRSMNDCQICVIYPDKLGANIIIPRNICKKMSDSSDEYTDICIIDNHKYDDITLTFEADVAFAHNLCICSTMGKGSTLTIAKGDLETQDSDGCFCITGIPDWDFNKYPTINEVVGLSDYELWDMTVPADLPSFGFNVILDSKIKYSIVSCIGQGNTITQRKGHLGRDEFELYHVTLK